jgi:hypothetical protein
VEIQTMKTSVGDLFRGRFVTGQDLVEGPMTVELTRWSMEKLPLGGERVVVWFRDGNDERGLPLNKTNARRLSEIFGSDALEDWKGKRVVLFLDESVQGPAGRQGGVRVRAVADASATRAASASASEQGTEVR